MSKPPPDQPPSAAPQADAGQGAGAARAASQRAAELANQKAEAEVRKLECEVEKLARELAAAPSLDLVRQRAEAELNKLKREAEKIEKESRILPNGPWLERFKAIGALSSVLLAVVALAGLWVSVETARQAGLKAERDAQRNEREMMSSLIRDLSAGPPTLRAASAVRLGGYFRDDALRPHAIGSLISALGFEGEDQVQAAILQTLTSAGPSAQEPLAEIRKTLSRELGPLFSKVDEKTRLPTPETISKIESRQQSMIKITLAMASHAQCAAPPCPPDFSRLDSLRRSDFFTYPDRLRRADFRETSLSEADFYGVDLSGARFDNAKLEAASFIGAKLVGANFDGANMRPVWHGSTMLKRAMFTNADLSGASFVDACLSGADFTGSRNLDLAALARAFTQGIVIEPDRLARLGAPRSHEKCRDVRP